MRSLVPFVVAAVLLVAAGTGEATLPAGVTSWWPANGDTTDTVSGHNATLMGGAGYAAAVLGQGWAFDSSDDLVTVADNADFIPGSRSFSVDAWIKTTSGDNAVVVRHYECSGFCPSPPGDWDLRVYQHRAYGYIRDDSDAGPDSGGQELDGTTAVDDGAFHHLALVRDMAAGRARLYVDGALQDEESLGPGSNGAISDEDSDPDPVSIGGGVAPNSTGPDAAISFTGIIDEVHWWRDTALTGDQVAAICAEADPPPASTATAPATGTVGQPLTVNYSVSGGLGATRVILLVGVPGAAGFTEAATDSTNSGSFTFTPTAAGAYGFATRAEDASCGREAPPADPDAVTTVAAVTMAPSTNKPPAPTPVPISQIATLPSPHVCVSRRHFPIHIKGVKGVVKAVIQLSGVPARTVKGKALGLPIDLRGLPKGKVVVKITITTKAGKRLVGKRTYHTCASKRIVKKKH